MRPVALCLGGALLFAAAGAASPAMACSFSRPVFTAGPAQPQPVRVRVDQILLIGGQVGGGVPGAVRATVLDDSTVARRGDRITIIVASGNDGNCYFGGLAEPEAVSGAGTLEAYVSLSRAGDRAGAFSAWPATDSNRRRYAAFMEGRLRGRWVRARFATGGEPVQ